MIRGKKATRRTVIYVVNEREDEYVYFKSEEANLSIRSMLMEDINYVTKLKKLSFKEKKALKRELENEESEIKYYVIEEINQYKGSAHKVVAIAELKSNGDIYAELYLSQDSSSRAYNFESNIMIGRIHILLEEFFKETNNFYSYIYISRSV